LEQIRECEQTRDTLIDLPPYRWTPLIRSFGSWKVDDEQDEASVCARIQA
jgi:hypothetical protein